MDALEILKGARAKIADPAKWGKGVRSRDRDWGTCCVAEAIEEVDTNPIGHSKERQRAFRAIRNASGLDDEWASLTSWNDDPERTHPEVLAAFDLAIATLRLS